MRVNKLPICYIIKKRIKNEGFEQHQELLLILDMQYRLHVSSHVQKRQQSDLLALS